MLRRLSSLALVLLLFIPLLSNALMISIQYRSTIIGMIGAKRILSGSISVADLFNLIDSQLKARDHVILSKYFQISFNGTVITRDSPDLNAINNVDSFIEPSIIVSFPEHIKVASISGYCCFDSKRWTLLNVTNGFEMEFDVVNVFVDNPEPSLYENLLLFFESDSTKLAIWADVSMNHTDIQLRVWKNMKDRRRWTTLLTMRFLHDAWDDKEDDLETYQGLPSLGHFYLQIGNGSQMDLVTIRVRGQTKQQIAGMQLFKRREIVRVWFFKAVYRMKYEIRNVITLTA